MWWVPTKEDHEHFHHLLAILGEEVQGMRQFEEHRLLAEQAALLGQEAYEAWERGEYFDAAARYWDVSKIVHSFLDRQYWSGLQA